MSENSATLPPDTFDAPAFLFGLACLKHWLGNKSDAELEPRNEFGPLNCLMDYAKLTIDPMPDAVHKQNETLRQGINLLVEGLNAYRSEYRDKAAEWTKYARKYKELLGKSAPRRRAVKDPLTHVLLPLMRAIVEGFIAEHKLDLSLYEPIVARIEQIIADEARAFANRRTKTRGIQEIGALLKKTFHNFDSSVWDNSLENIHVSGLRYAVTNQSPNIAGEYFRKEVAAAVNRALPDALSENKGDRMSVDEMRKLFNKERLGIHPKRYLLYAILAENAYHEGERKIKHEDFYTLMDKHGYKGADSEERKFWLILKKCYCEFTDQNVLKYIPKPLRTILLESLQEMREEYKLPESRLKSSLLSN